MSSQLVIEWAAMVPVAALMLLSMYLPGSVLLLLLRARPTAVLAGGPLMTAALLGIGGMSIGRFGAGFGWGSFLGLTAVLWAFGLLLRALVVKPADRVPERERQQRAIIRIPHGAPLFLALALVALGTLCLPLMIMVEPGVPSPRVDPMFHYNVLNAVEETGTVAMTSAVDYNHGLRVGHVTYPTVWHAVAMLGVPIAGIVPSANVLAYVVTPAIFVANASLLVRVVFRNSPAAIISGILAAGAFPAFPAALQLNKAFWPNSLAIALLPGALVLLMMLLRRTRWTYIRRHRLLYLLDLMIVGAALCGLGLAHPSVLFNFLFIAAPLLMTAALRAERIMRRSLSIRKHRVFVACLVLAPLIGLAALLVPAQVRSYLMRPGTQEWDRPLLKIVSMLVNWPTDVTNILGVIVAAVYVPVIVAGVGILIRSRGRKWIALAWSVNLMIIAGSYFPIPVLSGISGLWYSDTYRLYAVQVTILPLVVGSLIDHVSRGVTLRTRGAASWRTLWAWAAIVCALLGTTYIASGEARHVGVGSTIPRPVMTNEEQVLIQRVGDELPPGSVVLGDPASGIAYVSLDSDVETVFTQVNLRDVDEDGIFLADRFNQIHDDPRVCQVLKYYGIGYFYEDRSMQYNNGVRADVVPGLYGVDTSSGFTKIDEGGGATLWRIDACGQIDPPEEWFERDWRRAPVLGRFGPYTCEETSARLDWVRGCAA